MFAAVGGLVTTLVIWLAGATALIVYNDDLVGVARDYQTQMQRDYEDRIASLRAQIEEITTRRFLDQQAVEARMASLTAAQEEIAARQSRMTALLDDAQKRGLAVEARASAASGAAMPMRPKPLMARFSSLRGTSTDRRIDLVDVSVETLAERLEEIDGEHRAVLAGLAGSLGEHYRTLAEVPKALGLKVAGAERAAATGGPFIPARGTPDGGPEIDMSLERLEDSFAALKALEGQVRRLPVRQPLAAHRGISSEFGTRRDPFLGRLAFHSGIDYAADRGIPVRATAAGKVIHAGRHGGYGIMVEVDHGNGLTTRYAHLSRVEVKEGDQVGPGAVVGRVGSTGRSTGPHLHYETRAHGEPVDPVSYLTAGRLLPKQPR